MTRSIIVITDAADSPRSPVTTPQYGERLAGQGRRSGVVKLSLPGGLQPENAGCFDQRRGARVGMAPIAFNGVTSVAAATLATTAVPGSITAVYSGDSNYNGSTFPPLPPPQAPS